MKFTPRQACFLES